MPDADLASSVRRGGRIPASNAEVAFQCQTQTSRPLSDAEVAFQPLTRRSSDTEVAFQLKRKPEQLRVPTQTRAFELRVSTSERGPRPARDPQFCYN